MDGIFVLRMITIHSGILICTDVVDTMWDQFLSESGEQPLTFTECPSLSGHGVIASLLEEKSQLGDDDRAPSAGGMSIEQGMRRKTSVLVPLMSREDLTQEPAFLTPAPQFLRPPSSRINSACV